MYFRFKINENREKDRQASHRLAAAYQTNGNSFDLHRMFARINDDRFKIRILGDQLDDVSVLTETLDRHVVFEPGNDDLTVACFAATVNRQQVTIEDTGVNHR